MKFPLVASLALMLAVAPLSFGEDQVADALNFKMTSLDGKEVNLADYKGKVVLMVNVASRCGATPQYEGLQALYQNYKDDGLVVLGFPCNQFGSQEPGTALQIQEFCTTEYGVTFPMFSKIDVNGDKASPLYKFLTSTEKNPKFAGPIRWNFEKFLIDREGQVVARFKTGVEPDSEELTKALKEQLSKK